MKHACRIAVAVIALCALLASHGARAIVIGQVDTFEDGTTRNWLINVLGMGSPPPLALPANVPDGGPDGPNDSYLQLTSLGTGGAGGRLVALNLAQWSGNYALAGVGGIAMDVINLGTSDLSLRLLFEHLEGGPPTDVATSTNAVFVPAGSGWRHVVFPVAAPALTALLGNVDDVLESVSVLRIFHSATVAFPPDPIVARLGVDNIAAVPEPASLALVAGALLLVAGGRACRSRR